MKFDIKYGLAFLLITGFVFATITPLQAQGKVSERDPNVIEYPIEMAPKYMTIDPKEISEDWYPYMHNYRVIHTPGVDVEKDKYLAHKAKITKDWAEKVYAGETGSTGTAGKTQTAATPTLELAFLGNPYDGGFPNDNALAVSRHGWVVSATNSQIRAWPSWGGSPVLQNSMQSFSGSLGGAANKYDPKVVYHSAKDRFVIVFLVGSTSGYSRVLIAFSSTENPGDPWNIYTLEGNATGNVWTDFPQIALSYEELVITGNLFTDAGVGTGSVVWQVQLDEGFNGDPNLVTKRYTSSYFSLHPVEGAPLLTHYPMYLIRGISNPFSSTKSVFVHELTGYIQDNGSLNPPVNLNSNLSYSLAPDANQQGTNIKLQTNDCRIQTSYINNNRIEYAHNTNNGAGRPSIFHGTIELSSSLAFSTVTGRYITIDSFEIGYPGIAYGGCSGADGSNSSLMMFCFTSNNHFPGNGCVFVNEAGEISAPLICKYGFTYMGDSNPWRWGDYADADERRNNPGEIWIGGSVGINNSQHQNATWISMVYTECNTGAVSVEDQIDQEEFDITAYPTPAVDLINFKFDVPETNYYEVKVMDLEGRVIKTVVASRLKAGAASAQFNTIPLSNGLYFVVVESKDGRIYTEKFMVKH